MLSISERTVTYDHHLRADERWHNHEELDLYTLPPLPLSYSHATEDFSPDLSIEDIQHITALHSFWFNAERNERLHVYDDDDVDDGSISSDDTKVSLDPDDPNASFFFCLFFH